MISPELIEQIRDAADIVAVIGEHVELKRTGSDFRGPCPFHGGTHRNFSVVPKKQLYHCFVCHESGDVFTFWMKRFGLDYPTAVREIAAKVGIAVPDARAAGPDPNEPLYSALGVAAEWFARRLREAEDAAPAREYLDRRGLDEAVRDLYQLGFAPARGEAMLDALRALGIADAEMVAAGLAAGRDDGALASRFRGRLIFPIADARGRIVGFGGRLLGDGEPKYLNSPETPTFQKGTLLYGLDRARGLIRTEGLAVLVEGYVDVIRLQAAGIGCAVAPLGTALTGAQARVLRRYTRQVALAYDADPAGLRSTFRAGDELLRQAITVNVVTLPAGQDPDTLVARGGADAFRELLAEAVDLFERKIQLLDRRGLFRSLEGRRHALDRLLPTIRAAADPITRGLYVALAAEKSGVAKEVLEREVGRLEKVGAGRAPGGATARAAGGQVTDRPDAVAPDVPAERVLVQLMLTDASWVRRVTAEAAIEQFRHPVYREIAARLLAGQREPAASDEAAAWERLGAPPEGPFNAEAAFAEAVAWLAERPRRERLAEIDGLIGLASPAEKEALFDEKRALLAGGGVRYRRKALQAEREPQF
ncbi:MAG: DNA primase [Gemmatimonadetes bacterium]|nr:DNA primase [Gemmatimonadota bacterium]